MKLLKRLWNDESGQDLVEYGLLVAVIALGCTAAMAPVATAIVGVLDKASSALTSAT